MQIRVIAKIFYVVLGAFLLLMSACSTIDVSENYDINYDFSGLKTYDIVPVENKKHELVVKQLTSELRKQLTNKGFKQNTSNPDFLVALHGGTEDKVIIHTSVYNYSYGGWYERNYRGMYYDSRVDMYEYKEGTLVIDIIDAKNKSMIFQSTTIKTIDEGASMEKRQENIKKVITIGAGLVNDGFLGGQADCGFK